MPARSILFINRVYPPYVGATGRVVKDLSVRMAKKGWDVHVLTCGREEKTEQLLKHLTIHRMKVSKRPSSALRYFFILLRLTITALRMPKYDVVVTMTDPPMLVFSGRLLSLFKRSKHIHWVMDLYPDLFPVINANLPGFLQRIMYRVSRRSMRKAAKVIVIGRCMARHLARTGIPVSKMSVIPNWSDPILLKNVRRNKTLEDFSKVAHHQSEVENFNRSSGKISPLKFRVLYAGTVGRAHEFDTILDAAEILQREEPLVEFVFVGGGYNFNRLAEERMLHNLDNIRLLPWQPQKSLRTVLESGDLHIVTMKNEACGMLVPSKIYSCLAVNRPVVFIGPEDCEATKVIKGFKAGTCLPVGDARLFADTVKDYVHNAKLWFDAQEGARDAANTMSPERVMDAWISKAREVFSPPISKTRKRSTPPV